MNSPSRSSPGGAAPERASRRARLARWLRAAPFTLALQASVLAVALATGAFEPGRGARLEESAGFGWPDLATGRLAGLVVSVFLVSGAGQWVRIAALLLVSVLPLEVWRGSRVALIVYWTTGLVAELGGALVQGLAARLSGDAALASLRDVGASAGAYGCLGAMAALAPAPWRGRAAAALLGFCLLRPLLVSLPVADATHAVAALAGLAAGRWLARGGRDVPRPRAA